MFDPIILKDEITIKIEDTGDDTIDLSFSIEGKYINGHDWVRAKLKNGEIDWDWARYDDPNIEIEGGPLVEMFLEKYGDGLIEEIRRRKIETDERRKQEKKVEEEKAAKREIKELEKKLAKLKAQ